jgi:hypothetical protein
MYRVKRVGFVFLGLGLLAGCRTAHDVAVSSFRVLDAPANYVRRHIDGDNRTTSTTASSDTVTTPGRTVTPSTTDQRTTTKPNPPPRSSPSAVTAQIPTAKPVPGKPGYVFSPFDASGGYVDVTGYTSGQKVKDPYSGKIFLIP